MPQRRDNAGAVCDSGMACCLKKKLKMKMKNKIENCKWKTKNEKQKIKN